MATSDLTFEAVDWDIARELLAAFWGAADSGSGDDEHAAAVALAHFVAEVEALAP